MSKDARPVPKTTLFYFSGELPAETYLRNLPKLPKRVGILLTFASLAGKKNVARRRLEAFLNERK